MNAIKNTTIKRLPRTPDGLIGYANDLIDLLRASQISVASDYHLGIAIGRVEAAIEAIQDLKNESIG